MSFVIAAPEFVTAAASDLAKIGSTISATHAAAASTTVVIAAAGDEVSAAIASLFSGHAREFSGGERAGGGLSFCSSCRR